MGFFGHFLFHLIATVLGHARPELSRAMHEKIEHVFTTEWTKESIRITIHAGIDD